MIAAKQPFTALLVDPSLFTAPYDAALDQGLRSAGVDTRWAVRPVRSGDRADLPTRASLPLFYRHVDRLHRVPPTARKLLKGSSHVVGLARTLKAALWFKADLLHFQWTVVPVLDALAILVARIRMRVVLTVHDTTPHNGERMPLLQRFAFDVPIRLADRVIVHTRDGKARLVARGIAANKIDVIAHGPLLLPPALDHLARSRVQHASYTFTLFGELKHYKGLDVLVNAVAALAPCLRARTRVVVAGQPKMDLLTILARIHAMGLQEHFELRLQRQTEAQMAALFAETDCFVFPYRQVDASGAYFLTRSYSRWTIASRVGIFPDVIREGTDGALITPESAEALADAMKAAVLRNAQVVSDIPSAMSWLEIGRLTRLTYISALRGSGRARRGAWNE